MPYQNVSANTEVSQGFNPALANQNSVVVKRGTVPVHVNVSQAHLLRAASQQGIPLSKVFAKVTHPYGETHVSYPMVVTDSKGHIPVTEDGTIISNPGLCAKMLKFAKAAHEYEAVQKDLIGGLDGFI